MQTTDQLLEPPQTLVRAACAHCGLECPPAPPTDTPSFCCSGCETVYRLLDEQGLTDYYRFAEGAKEPARVSGRSYAEFDADSFHTLYVREASDGLASVDLYLEGVRCAACVWLVEKLPRLLPGVQSVRLQLGRSLAHVRWDPTQVSLSQIAQALDSLGYSVHAYRGVKQSEQRRGEDRAFLIRLAVAGALAGNVMLVSFALYGGALNGMDPAYAQLFRWLSFGLTVPAVLGPGREFLRGAWAALRTRTPHMDLPVGLALVVGLSWGGWNTIRGAGEIYFDTLSILVFFLLVGRWLQRRHQRKALDSAELLGSLSPTSARRVSGSGDEEAVNEVPLEVLEAGDVVEVRAGDTIPVDGTVSAGSSQIDTSLLTGESRPVSVGMGEPVFAGTANLSAALRIKVEESGEQTRVGRLMQRVQELTGDKAPVVQWANAVAGRFVIAVLVLAALTLAAWWPIDPARAIDNAVALLIVTCPCALGLATPLAVSAALGLAARRGVLIKGGDVLQRLEKPGRLWLDKTGTLSEGQSALVSWTAVGPQDQAGVNPATTKKERQPLKSWILGLEADSSHPVAHGFRKAWPNVNPTAPDAPPIQDGGGVHGRFGGETVLAGSPACLEAAGIELNDLARSALTELLEAGETPVVVAVNGRPVAIAGFGDPLRSDASETVQALSAAGWEVGILSGDHPRIVAAMGAQLGLPADRCRGAQSPEQKLATIRQSLSDGPVVMVGDGVNDAAALAAASVGIGVHGGSEATLAAADVFFSKPGLGALLGLLTLSRSTLRRIRLNLGISLTYNVVAAALAAAGIITPLLAAVLMPLSSLGVIANSYRGRLTWN